MSRSTRMARGFKIRTGVALLCASALTLAACSSGTGNSTKAPSSGSTTTTATGSNLGSGLPAATVKNAAIINGLKKDPTLASMVPAAWRSKGTVRVATSASYPPDEFFASNNTTIVGWDPDLGHALAKLLGLNFKFVNVNFDEIIPGLAAKRYDLAMSSAGVEPYREKIIDFVTDFRAGLAFMVQKGSSIHPTSIASLCGLTVAAEKGSVEAVVAQNQASSCTKSGKKPLKLLIYPDQNSVNLALSSNRAQVAFADSPVVAYEVKITKGKFVQSGGVYEAGPEGIEISKGNNGMRKALQAAMNKLISTGVYRKILTNWGVQSGAITQSELEPPISGGAS